MKAETAENRRDQGGVWRRAGRVWALAGIAAAVLFAGGMRAQSAPSGGPAVPSECPQSATHLQPPVQASPTPGPIIEITPDSTTSVPPPSGGQAGEQHAPLTKEQAKDLFKSVDEILAFVSKDTDLADPEQQHQAGNF